MNYSKLKFLLITLICLSETLAWGYPAVTSQLYLATYTDSPVEQTAEILANGVVVVPDVRVLEPLCVSPIPLPTDVKCSTFTMVMPPGAKRTIQMRGIDPRINVRSDFSNAIDITQPFPARKLITSTLRCFPAPCYYDMVAPSCPLDRMEYASSLPCR